jgi:predicted DNA binding CopG/RHH family protein
MLKNIIPGRKIQKKYLKGVSSITAKLSPEKKAISIRLLESDIERIKAKSLGQGLPYHTLISSLIHQHANDKIKFEA